VIYWGGCSAVLAGCTMIFDFLKQFSIRVLVQTWIGVLRNPTLNSF
jgi:hypothetical protein